MHSDPLAVGRTFDNQRDEHGCQKKWIDDAGTSKTGSRDYLRIFSRPMMSRYR